VKYKVFNFPLNIGMEAPLRQDDPTVELKKQFLLCKQHYASQAPQIYPFSDDLPDLARYGYKSPADSMDLPPSGNILSVMWDIAKSALKNEISERKEEDADCQMSRKPHFD
jgi:hypothetical protein